MKSPIPFSITGYVCDENCYDCNHNKFPFWYCCKFCSKCSPQKQIVEGLTYYYIEIYHDRKLMILKSLLTANAIDHEYVINDNILKCWIAYQGKMRFSNPLFHQNGIIYYDKLSMHGITMVSVVNYLRELCSEPVMPNPLLLELKNKLDNDDKLYLKLAEFKNKLVGKLNHCNTNYGELRSELMKFYEILVEFRNKINNDSELYVKYYSELKDECNSELTEFRNKLNNDNVNYDELLSKYNKFKNILDDDELYSNLIEFKNKLETKLKEGNINYNEEKPDKKLLDDLLDKYGAKKSENSDFRYLPFAYVKSTPLVGKIRTLMWYMYMSKFSKFLINASITNTYHVTEDHYNVYDFEPFEEDLTIKLEPVVLLTFENLIKIYNTGKEDDYIEAANYIYNRIEQNKLGETPSKSINYRRFYYIYGKIISFIKDNKFRAVSALPPKETASRTPSPPPKKETESRIPSPPPLPSNKGTKSSPKKEPKSRTPSPPKKEPKSRTPSPQRETINITININNNENFNLKPDNLIEFRKEIINKFNTGKKYTDAQREKDYVKLNAIYKEVEFPRLGSLASKHPNYKSFYNEFWEIRNLINPPSYQQKKTKINITINNN